MNSRNRQFLLGCLFYIHALCLGLLSFTTFHWVNPALNLSLLISQITLVATWQAVGSMPAFRRHVLAGIMYCLLILASGFYPGAAGLVVLLAFIIQVLMWFQKRRGFRVVCLGKRGRVSAAPRRRFAILDLILSQLLIALLAYIGTHEYFPRDGTEFMLFLYRFLGVLMPHMIVCTFIVFFAMWICLSPERYTNEQSVSYAVLIVASVFLALLFLKDREHYLLMQFFIYSSLLVVRATQYRIIGPGYKKSNFKNACPQPSKLSTAALPRYGLQPSFTHSAARGRS